ncbi:MAG: histone deacetylase [Deltaproteobacteria bacterium]|nr:MAG: histone deacetylase [Deltaproteobacteria bacterium]
MKFPKAGVKTGVVFFPAFDWAISANHPEREERLLYTRDQIFEEGLFDVEGITEYPPSLATVEDVERVHLCLPSPEKVVTSSHYISAGGAIAVGEAVMKGEVERGFALVRPPGHHATRVVRGLRGFCVINIEAVMLEYLRKQYGPLRVAIIDTDCHHGDGTQEVYWNDPDTLFISLHQDGRTLYPGTGFPSEFGGPGGYGATLNIPMPPGTGDKGYLYVIDNFVLPVLEDFKPDLVINSAGQDNHFSDPLTNMSLTAKGYAELTRRLSPHLAVLEGGYSVQSALPYVNTGILLALAGLDTSNVIEPLYSPEVSVQSKKTDEFLKELCEMMLYRYENRENLFEESFGDKEYHETTKNLFHDEAGISEHQREKTRICRDCPGVTLLATSAPGYSEDYLITLPLRGCPRCRREAEEAFANASTEEFDTILFQDRPNDVTYKKGGPKPTHTRSRWL